MTPKRAVLLALSSVVLAAHAQDAGTAKPGPLDAACKQDLEAFCATVQPGEGRMVNWADEAVDPEPEARLWHPIDSDVQTVLRAVNAEIRRVKAGEPSQTPA